MGPGPPKGWEPHKFLRDARKKLKRNPEPDRETESELDIESQQPVGRPSYERRISSALENVKGTLKSSLHPEKWNWKRYDREDEFLGGFHHTVRGMWDKVTSSVGHGDDPNSMQSLRRERTTESERIDYTRGHIPAVNDLHPPVVSQLPATREEVAWMILPPPSADIMAGRKPPAEEIGQRKPLCIIGRIQPKPDSARATPVLVDKSTIDDTSSLEVFDAESVAASESAPSTPPPARIEINKRALHMFDALSDTEMFKSPARPPVQPRPRSWQFHYVIPSPVISPPSPVQIQ